MEDLNFKPFDNGHSILSPSGWSMWSNCTGSLVGLNNARKVATDNVASIEGTTAHTLLEIAITLWTHPSDVGFSDVLKMTVANKSFLKDLSYWCKNVYGNVNNSEETLGYMKECVAQIEGGSFTDEMRIEVGKCYDRIKAYKDDGWTILPERKVSLHAFFGHSHCDGSADVIIYKGTRLILADLKYGKGIEVSPVKNGQLSLYAGGAIDYVYKHAGVVFEDIDLVIMQPRINNGVWKVWSCTYSKENAISTFLQKAEVKVKSALEALNGGVIEYKPSISSCMWCHRKKNCKARMDEANKSVVQAFLEAGVSEGSQIDRGVIDNPTIAKLIDRSPFIVSFFKDMVEEAEQRARKGEIIDGHKLVKGRSSRKWEDGIQVGDFYNIGLTTKETLQPSKIKSPAQMDKVSMTPEQKLEVKRLTVVSFGKETLVSESDPREAVIKNVQQRFKTAMLENSK